MSKQPDIVFIFSDQQHWQALGYEDPSFQTPNLNRLAAEGTIFTNAFCTTPQCSPSRSSIMTGLYPSKTGVLGNIGAAGGDPLQMPTISKTLKQAGYNTAYFGKWHLGKDKTGTGNWDEDFGVTGPETIDDKKTTADALDYLNRHQNDDQPFALFLSYNDPHDVYHFKRTQPDLDNLVDLPETWHHKDLSTTPVVQQQFMDEDQGRAIVNEEPTYWGHYRKVYREKVNLYDSHVGKVLGTLDQYGLFDQTLIVVTSDHGDMDGQHGLIYKGPFMYEHMMRVPLIIKPPNSSKNNTPVNFHTVNVDLAPTLADYAGTGPYKCDGVSLKPFLTNEQQTPTRDFVIGQYYSKQKWVNPIRMIRTEQYKYNLYQLHGEELYDLQNDPLEIENLAGQKQCETQKSQLRETLDKWIKENNDPFYTQTPTTRNGEPLTSAE